jgi:peptide/nickel transport system permease protein
MIASQSLRQFVALQQIFGEGLSVVIIITIVVVFGWMTVTRLLYGSVLSLKQQEFVEAARALGASPARMIMSHLVPNSLAPIIVATTLDFGAIVVYEATLSFLGLGIMPPTPSWGNMLTDVQRFMIRDPMLAIYPGMCIFLTVLAINFIGDGLRDALDPRLKI